MPGYFIHLAVCGKNSLENRSFVCGVEAPDILKKHLKDSNENLEIAREKYEKMKTNDMPDYSVFVDRLLQTEKRGSTDGMHYGKSSSTNVRAFWNDLSKEQRDMPFYKGYVWHLLTDAIMYGRLNIDKMFTNVLQQRGVTKEEWDKERAHEVDVLHTDWDKTNELVRTTYPEIFLTPEVEELNVVQFVADENLTYVNWSLIKNTIDYLRSFDPLNGDMENIIEEILSNI